MAKKYTAQEIRDMAFFFDRNHDQFIKARSNSVLARIPETIAILCQAADALELEENRPKEYEYAVEYYDKTNGKKVIGVHYKSVNEAKALSIKGKDLKKTYVRRAVGEWEEVKDGE